MNILICSDSFKDSLSSREVSYIIRDILFEKFPNANINCVPLADGGEGSLSALEPILGGEIITHSSVDALLRPITASFLLFRDKHHAIVELAQTCGLALLDQADRNCLYTSTYGVGLQIKKAIEHKAHTIDLLIGGSSTNDLGLGMVAALSHDFSSYNKKIKYPTGKDLLTIDKIVSSALSTPNVVINVITDVNNILLGSDGATFTYGLQKGASEEELIKLEAGAENIVKLVQEFDSTDYHLRSGAGASGGVGYGAMAFLGAARVSGIDYMIDQLALTQKIDDADLVITGEGKMDSQTNNGKLVSGICKLAQSKNKEVVAVCAINELSQADNYNLGIKAIYPMYEISPLQISKHDSEIRLKKIASDIIDKHIEW